MKLIYKNPKLILLQSRMPFEWPDHCLCCGQETFDVVQRQPEDQRRPLLQAASALMPPLAILLVRGGGANPKLSLPVCKKCRRWPRWMMFYVPVSVFLGLAIFYWAFNHLLEQSVVNEMLLMSVLITAFVLLFSGIILASLHSHRTVPLRILLRDAGYEYRITGGYVCRWACDILQDRKSYVFPEKPVPAPPIESAASRTPPQPSASRNAGS